jgi:hypothetical protein
MAALDIPIVPVNSDAKTFAAMSLTQAINNMHLAQAGGGAQTQQNTDEQKRQKALKDQADKDARTKESRDRNLFNNNSSEEESLPRDSSGAPVTPAASGGGLGGPNFGPPPGGGVSGITGTTDQYGNTIPSAIAPPSTGEIYPVEAGF